MHARPTSLIPSSSSWCSVSSSSVLSCPSLCSARRRSSARVMCGMLLSIFDGVNSVNSFRVMGPKRLDRSIEGGACDLMETAFEGIDRLIMGPWSINHETGEAKSISWTLLNHDLGRK